MNCYVYWIKRKSHADPLSEGYIGISSDPQRRFNEHQYSDFVVGRAIKKYKDIELIILHEYENRDLALLKENEYRPKVYIGWNTIVGGDEPPRNHLTEDVKKKISDTLKKNGACPYSEKTHSVESITKAKQTKKEKQYRWFHNPETLEYYCLPTNEEVPNHLVPGRVPKKEKVLKPNKGNTQKWKVFSPNGEVFDVENLKTWCKEQSIPYLATFSNRTNGWKGWKCQKI
jgi:predicted GIY-YIG superfamily endonuclease